MQELARKRSSKIPPVYLRVSKGCLVPADSYAENQLRAKGYKVGDLIKSVLTKPNNPKFHRLFHRIGQLCAKNIEAFNGMDAHQVIKRLQWEGNIWCEELGVVVPGVGLAMMRFPISTDFATMDDGARHEAARAMCRYISEKYWPDLSADQVAEMAESWVDE